MKNLILAFAFALMFGPTGQKLLAQSTYSLPNVTTDCPSNCRLITWQAGSDLWNDGTLPVYPAGSVCSGLVADGVTDNTRAINACISAQSSGHAAVIPAGTYYVNGTVRLLSGVVLRGKGTSSTFINLGARGGLTTQNFSFGGHLNPITNYATLPSTYTLRGSPQKGDTTVTIGSGRVSVGTWIKIFGNDDPTLIDDQGTDGWCAWCADNTGYYLMQQIVQVTAITSGSGGAGSVVAISRPIYYPPYTGAVTNAGGKGSNEPAGAKYNIIKFPTQKAGYENFKVTATGDIGANSIILMQGCLYCWVSGVETQTTGSSSDSAHVQWMESYGGETRDNYFHDQRSGASGSGYGIYFKWVNGDQKVENNIVRHNRHGIVWQGGGSGSAVLYNYIDDAYTDDLTYNGSARTGHGAHPFFNLFEGNSFSHIAADDFSGTTSHIVFFRNWLWGDYTGNWTVPTPGTDAPTPASPDPQGGFDAVDLYQNQEYYSFVGNILGNPGLHATWSAATLSLPCALNSCGYQEASAPGVYSYGNTVMHSGGLAATSSGTILRHGNYDYLTKGVAYWDGGSNHSLASSLYYASKPSFFGRCTWPVYGYDLAPMTNTLPAQSRYNNGTSVCTVSVSLTPPATVTADVL